MSKRSTILFITASYPDKEHPYAGIFVREHAKAVQLYNDVVVLHCCIEYPQKKGLWHIEEEKDRIESDFYEDKDCEQSKNDELTYKNQIREKNAELRKAMAEVNVDQQLSTYEYNINVWFFFCHISLIPPLK